MFFWNMEKRWRKEAACPKKNRKPFWRQYLKICRKVTVHRCGRSWDLWDCKIERTRRIFPLENTPYPFTGKADPTAEEQLPENSRRKFVFLGFSGDSALVSVVRRVLGSPVFHTYIPPPVTTLCGGKKVFSLFLHGQGILCYDKKD